jgi:hypothetical protein
MQENESKSFQGSIVLGMGFTFDDKNPDATPIAEMQRLIEKDPRNREKIYPYIGGEEVNESPTHEHHRYVINFGEMSESEARNWPDLMAIVEKKVRPERLRNNRESYRRWWWQHAEKRSELFASIANLNRVLVTPFIGKWLGFAYVTAATVIAAPMIAFPVDSFRFFSVLQSRSHEIWARFLGSSMKDDLRYTPSDCFETFPFPPNWESHPALEAVGKEYYEFRAQLMVRNNEGLTTTYNRFHDPDELDPEICKLRALHDAMDRAVLDAYGWTDLRPSCEFLLDYEEAEDEAEEESGRPRRKKKPWRYRWPDAVRDEVLARLLALNAERAQKEKEEAARAALLGERAPKSRNKRTPPAGSTSGGQGSLF